MDVGGGEPRGARGYDQSHDVNLVHNVCCLFNERVARAPRRRFAAQSVDARAHLGFALRAFLRVHVAPIPQPSSLLKFRPRVCTTRSPSFPPRTGKQYSRWSSVCDLSANFLTRSGQSGRASSTAQSPASPKATSWKTSTAKSCPSGNTPPADGFSASSRSTPTTWRQNSQVLAGPVPAHAHTRAHVHDHAELGPYARAWR